MLLKSKGYRFEEILTLISIFVLFAFSGVTNATTPACPVPCFLITRTTSTMESHTPRRKESNKRNPDKAEIKKPPETSRLHCTKKKNCLL